MKPLPSGLLIPSEKSIPVDYNLDASTLNQEVAPRWKSFSANYIKDQIVPGELGGIEISSFVDPDKYIPNTNIAFDRKDISFLSNDPKGQAFPKIISLSEAESLDGIFNLEYKDDAHGIKVTIWELSPHAISPEQMILVLENMHFSDGREYAPVGLLQLEARPMLLPTSRTGLPDYHLYDASKSEAGYYAIYVQGEHDYCGRFDSNYEHCDFYSVSESRAFDYPRTLQILAQLVDQKHASVTGPIDDFACEGMECKAFNLQDKSILVLNDHNMPLIISADSGLNLPLQEISKIAKTLKRR